MCPGAKSVTFKHNAILESGKSPLEQGFFVHEIRRKVNSIFIIDRSEGQERAKTGHSLEEPPNIRYWTDFISVYTENFEQNNDEFNRLVFEPRISKLKISYTLASSLFGIESSRLALRQRLNALRAEGLLPAADPLHDAPLDISSPLPSSRETRAARL